jgi:hypothetical protein
MTTTMTHPVSGGRSPAIAPMATPSPTLLPPPAENGFERLVRLVRDNEHLFEQARELRVRLNRARTYLAEPQSNPILGHAQLNRLRNQHSGVLARLRANRIEAQELLAHTSPH